MHLSYHSVQTQDETSHAGLAVPQCYKDDVQSRWENMKFKPPTSENMWTDGHQNLHGWLWPGYLPRCKISLHSY